MSIDISKNEQLAKSSPVTRPSFQDGIRRRFFRTKFDALVTLLIVGLFVWIVPPLIDWAILSSVLFADDPALCRAPGAGACWAVIYQRYFYIFFGTYPPSEAWRPTLVMVMLLSLVVASCIRSLIGYRLLVLWLAGAVATYVLMRGGLFGLPLVDTTRWGGLPVTLILAVLSLGAALPIGILVALGRESKLPVLRWLCTAYVEFIRGVPLVAVLFMASVMLPLFLPEGLTVDRFLRALIAFTVFAAAYIAEVVRSGLRAIPRGQFEAASSMGLNRFQTYRLIVLPQALRLVIPALVNTFIEFFKDTSLVLVVGLLDLFNTGRSVLSDPLWLPFSTEVYVFLGMIYFAFCFTMSKFSQRMEGR